MSDAMAWADREISRATERLAKSGASVATVAQVRAELTALVTITETSFGKMLFQQHARFALLAHGVSAEDDENGALRTAALREITG